MTITNNQRSMKALVHGSLGNFLINGVAALLTFGLHVLLARALGHESYSDYAYAFTCLTFLSLLSVVGMDIAAQRFIASHQALSEWSLINGFIFRAIQLTLVASFILALGLYLILVLNNETIESSLADTLGIVVLALPVSALLLLAISILRGFRHPVLASWPRLIVRPVIFIAIVCFVIIQSTAKVSGQLAITLDLIATVIALVVAVFLLWKILPTQLATVKPSYLTKKWFSVALPFFSIACFQMFIRSFDLLYVGYKLGINYSGSYSAASRIAQLTAFGLMAINGVLPALVARHYAKKELGQVQKLVTIATLATFIFSFSVFIVIFFFSEQLLNIFGPEFVEASPVLIVLAFGQLVNALTGSVGFLLAMTGYQIYLFRVLAVAVVINFFLCVILVPGFGMVGAAASTAIVIAGSNIFLAFYCIRLISIDPSIFSIIKVIRK